MKNRHAISNLVAYGTSSIPYLDAPLLEAQMLALLGLHATQVSHIPDICLIQICACVLDVYVSSEWVHKYSLAVSMLASLPLCILQNEYNIYVTV